MKKNVVHPPQKNVTYFVFWREKNVVYVSLKFIKNNKGYLDLFKCFLKLKFLLFKSPNSTDKNT